MIWIILAIAVLATVPFYGMNMKKGYWDNGLNWKSGLAIVLAFVFVLAGLWVGTSKTQQISYTARSELGNLKDNSQTHGRFVLGTGAIDEYPAYTYYKKIGANQYQQRKLRDDGTRTITVFEDSKDPYVSTHQSGQKSFFGWWGYTIGFEITGDIEFHVPKGSIVNEVILDSED